MKKFSTLLYFLLAFLSVNAQTWNEIEKLLPTPHVSGSQNFGSQMAVEGNFMLVGATNYSEKGAAFLYEKVDEIWLLRARLRASDGVSSDNFGYAVAFNGDVAVVSADKATKGVFGPGPGAVYVFEKPTSGWSDMEETHKLTVAEGEAGDYFGCDVALEGNTLVIGAYGEANDGKADAGAAYVFRRENNSWNRRAKLTLSSAAAYDLFGYSLDVDNNVILVSAYLADVNGVEDAGAAYIFEAPETGWADMNETAVLTTPVSNTSFRFGISVDLDGDYVIGGAYLADYGQPDVGAAFVFRKFATGWENAEDVSTLMASDKNADDRFGVSVSLEGTRAVVGSFYADVNGKTNNGAVYLFEDVTSGSMLAESAKLTASSSESDDRMGLATVISNNRVFVGASMADKNAVVDAGAVYVFEPRVQGWVSTTDSHAIYGPLDTGKDHFGKSISIHGNFALISSPNYEDGAAFILENQQGSWKEIAKLTPLEGYGTGFGTVVALNENTAVVGASSAYVNGISAAGMVYVFEKPASGWTNMNETARLTPSDPGKGTFWGGRLALDTNTLLVGITSTSGRKSETGAAVPGVAYLFEKPEGGWIDMNETARLTASDGVANDIFGFSVAIKDNLAIVGSPKSIVGETTIGAFYVYKKIDTHWADMTEETKISSSDGNFGDNFGSKIILNKNTLLVTASMADVNGSENIGAAYIFEMVDENFTERAKLTGSDESSPHSFGSAIGLNDQTAFIGYNYYSNDVATKMGSVFVFEKPAAGWESTISNSVLTASRPQAHAMFGSSLAVFEEKLMVGAEWDDEKGIDAGAAYVFNSTVAPETPPVNPPTNPPAEKQSQYITMNVQETAFVGDVLALEAISSSGLPVAFNWEGPLNLVNGKLIAENEGIITITASQEGNDQYDAAEAVSATIEITKPVLTTVENSAISKIKFYPNPAQDFLTLEVPVHWENSTVEVRDMTGRTRIMSAIQAHETKLDVHLLEKGVYFLIWNHTTGQKTMKFLK